MEFPFIDNNLLMFRQPALRCKASVQPGFSPYLRAVLSESVEMVSPGFEVLKIPTELNIALNF